MNSSFSVKTWNKWFKKEQSQQEEEEEKEKEQPPLKCMKTSELQHSFSAMETLTDELYDTEHEWEQNAKVKGV